MTTIIIGRDPNNANRLNVMNPDGTVVKQVELKTAVPKSVSRQHAKVEVDDDGNECVVTNLKDSNVTYIDNTSFERRSGVPVTTTLQLGSDKCAVKLADVLKGIVEKRVDITPLEKVWTDYQQRKLDYQIANSRFSNMRSLSILFTVGGAFFAQMIGHPEWQAWCTGAGLLFTVVTFAIGHRNCALYPKKQQELDREFQSRYVCPSCVHFLGNKSYELLRQDVACPFCKAKYRH